MSDGSSTRRLYRSGSNRIIGGVLGGIGEYLDIDPVALRVLYILMAFLTGIFPMLLAYVVFLFIIPSKK
ncbi:MAG: PspC domain-containing protein [Candidatus Altiarchaeota archaeon]|nr:PspC domain-containing protein [Candidatus Altiarchaeota archaeon]